MKYYITDIERELEKTPAYKTLYDELFYSTSYDFEKLCHSLLRENYPTIRRSAALRAYDRAGFDLFVPSEENDDPEIFFQCKGFQENFGDSQYRQCIKSVKSFVKSTFDGKSYWLIINKKLNRKVKTELDSEIHKIKYGGKKARFDIIEIDEFIHFVYKGIVRNIRGYSSDRFNSYLNGFNSSIRQNIYYHDIPFIYKNRELYNPCEYIIQGMHKRSQEKRKNKNNKDNYLFVISEFGFGKTSLLFQLYRKFLKFGEFIPFIIPFTALDSKDFSNEYNISDSILKLITPKGNIKGKLGNFKKGVLQNILKNYDGVILLFDGLDEHKYFRDIFALQQFFNSISFFNAFIVISMRKEYWDERYTEIKRSLNIGQHLSKKIILKDWYDKQIVGYIKDYKDRSKLNPKQSYNLKVLEKLMLKGQYQEKYGEIPKRPLFLEMIIADEMYNSRWKSKVTIASLYHKYIKEKIIRDKTGAIISLPLKRGLKDKRGESIDSFVNRIFRVLERISAKMFYEDQTKIFADNIISSNDVRRIWEEEGFPDILDLLLHSVMVTVEERNEFDFKLKFAHFSFLEFFLSRFIVSDLAENKIWLGYEYEKSMLQFINSVLIARDHLLKDLLSLKLDSQLVKYIIDQNNISTDS